MADFLKIQGKNAYGIFNSDLIFNIAPNKNEQRGTEKFSIDIYSDAVTYKSVFFKTAAERDTTLTALYTLFGTIEENKGVITNKSIAVKYIEEQVKQVDGGAEVITKIDLTQSKQQL